MNFFKNFAFGLKAYWTALKIIHQQKFYWYMVFPALLMLVIYYFGEIVAKYQTNYNDHSVNGIFWSMMRMYIEIIIGLTFMKFSKYIVVIALSPMLSVLSLKTERLLTGNEYPFNFKQFYKDVIRGIRIGFRNVLWNYFFFALCFLIASIGWEHPEKSPVFYISFIIAFFYYGFSFMDYVCERLRWNMDDSVEFMRKHRGLAISIGVIYSFMILVPVDLGILFTGSSFKNGFIAGLGQYALHLTLWICAAFAPIWTIVAATIAMNNVVDLKKKKQKSI